MKKGITQGLGGRFEMEMVEEKGVDEPLVFPQVL